MNELRLKNRLRLTLIVIALGVAPMVLCVATSLLRGRSGEPLYLVNPLATPVEMTVDGQLTRLAPGQRVEVKVAEGPHRAVVKLSSGFTSEVPFTIENTFLSRHFNKNAFVLVALGAGAFEQVQHNWGKLGPGTPELYLGRPFLAFHNLHYVFTDPAADRTREDDDHAAFWVLDVSHQSPQQMLNRAFDPRSGIAAEDARVFAEGLIRGGERAPAFIGAYRTLGIEKGWGREAEEFLRQNVTPQ